MGHIDDFHIQAFRGLRDLKIANLGQINLFVGKNNSGKTSVLEAASLFCDPFSWRRWYDLAAPRESVSGGPIHFDHIKWIFPKGGNNTQNLASKSPKIELSASGDFPTEKVSVFYENFFEIFSTEDDGDISAEKLKLNVSVFVRNIQSALSGENTLYQHTIIFPTDQADRSQITTLPSQIVNPFSHRTSRLTLQLWSEVVEADLKGETIKLLQFFDPAIEDVDMISLFGGHGQILSIKHRKLGRAPLYTFGDGLRRVFTLATSIPRARNGLLLIDEIETAIHTKALEKTFDWIVEACVSHNVQLFATTHSLEALDALLEASRERADFVVYLLEQEEEQTTATGFNKEETLRLREELGMEMRF